MGQVQLHAADSAQRGRAAWADPPVAQSPHWARSLAWALMMGISTFRKTSHLSVSHDRLWAGGQKEVLTPNLDPWAEGWLLLGHTHSELGLQTKGCLLPSLLPQGDYLEGLAATCSHLSWGDASGVTTFSGACYTARFSCKSKVQTFQL